MRVVLGMSGRPGATRYGKQTALLFGAPFGYMYGRHVRLLAFTSVRGAGKTLIPS